MPSVSSLSELSSMKLTATITYEPPGTSNPGGSPGQGCSGVGSPGEADAGVKYGEGTVRFDLGDETAETWFRVAGDLNQEDPAALAPLVVLHGGPGATHDYLLSIADLSQGGRAVVH